MTEEENWSEREGGEIRGMGEKCEGEMEKRKTYQRCQVAETTEPGVCGQLGLGGESRERIY